MGSRSRRIWSVRSDAVLEEIAEWQNRLLEALYALVFFDALRVKVRDEGSVRNKAVYPALGVRPDGAREIPGLWIEQSEGTKFWLRVMNELRTRGVKGLSSSRRRSNSASGTMPPKYASVRRSICWIRLARLQHRVSRRACNSCGSRRPAPWFEQCSADAAAPHRDPARPTPPKVSPSCRGPGGDRRE
jgi:transposase-like protein